MNPNSIILDAIDRPIAVPPIFKKVAKSAAAAILLSQAWYWTKTLPQDRDGWFFKTQAEWEEETGLTRYEQETARKNLVKLGFLKEARKGNPARLWFCVCQTTLANEIAATLQSSMQQHHNLECSDAAIKNGETPQSLLTESTPETTTESTFTSTKEKSKRATSVPESVTENAMSWAREQGVSDLAIRTESLNFLDHHRAKGTTFKDWDAAFRTWIRNGIKWGRVVPEHTSSGQSLTQDELRQFKNPAQWKYGTYPAGYEGMQQWRQDYQNGTLPQLDGSRA